MRRLTVGFYGMTHLGLVTLLATATKDCSVIGYDSDAALIARLKNQDYPIHEPEFHNKVSKYRERIAWSHHLDVLLSADLIYVALDVPTNVENTSNLEPIRVALEALRQHHATQPIIVLSQVCPGFMRSQYDWGSHQLFYQVETLVFGHALERAEQPERIMIGCADPEDGLPACYAELLARFHCPLLIIRYESAELAKISINLYLVSSVMTSNLLANMASAVGADWQEIVPALRLDKRIGAYAYLSPGLGLAGGNLERDMKTYYQLAQQYQIPAEQITRWAEDNSYYRHWVWRCLQQYIMAEKTAPTIAILGLAYKKNTHSIKNSAALELIAALKHTTATVRVHDPVVSKDAVSEVLHCSSPIEALCGADVLIIMTPWEEYSKISIKDCEWHLSGQHIIDPYGVLDYNLWLRAGFHVHRLGVNDYIKEKHKEIVDA